MIKSIVQFDLALLAEFVIGNLVAQPSLSCEDYPDRRHGHGHGQGRPHVEEH
jgi:hypothetical protein